jgi:putative copper export protein/mono/diheme cytochrome c family protein
MEMQAVLLASLRGAHVVALVSLFGTLVSLACVAPADAAAARPRLTVLARWSAGLALVLGVAWLVLQSAIIAGAAAVASAVRAVLVVCRDTQFGHLIMLRLTLLLGAWPLLRHDRWRRACALVMTGAALAMQGAMGHAGATPGAEGTALLASEALHLLAAGAWLGGLLPLLLLIDTLSLHAASTACHDFSPIGLGAVVLIAGTAIVQAWDLIGNLAGLVGTHYGHIALLKLSLFLVLLVLACINRLVLTARLRETDNARRLMRGSLTMEATLGVAVIIAAAFLASSTPATHESPVWPFSRKPSFEALADPFARSLLLRALAPSLVAAVAVVVGFFWRVIFWPALAALVVCLVLAWPDVDLLMTTQAYPTTFVTSPTEFADKSIVRGQAAFRTNCVVCHGIDARGNGPAAGTLPIPPADLTAPHFWGFTEGDLYWLISHGIDAPSGKPAMPAFRAVLSSDTRWSLIDYLKAHNAGRSVRDTGRWDHPIQLPQFDAMCADGSAIDRNDLHGRVVHIVAAADGMPALVRTSTGLNVVTIVLSPPGHLIRPTGHVCASVEPATWDAFAILLGLPPDALAGTQALADQNGWLRARWRPGDPGGWDDSARLSAVVRDVADHPLAVSAGGSHAHHH